MVVSRKAEHVADGLPVPALRMEEGSLSPSAKKRANRQRSAMILARARAEERAVAARRQARLAGLAVSTALGALLLCATPSSSSLPEFTELSDADSYILLTPMKRTAVHSARVQYVDPVKSSGVLTASVAPGSEPKAAAKNDTVKLKETVNRVVKEDLEITRIRPAVVEPNNDLPHSGNLFELRDLFSSVDEETLPRTVLAAPGWPSKDQIALATSHFNAPGILRERSRTMVADARQVSPPVVTREAGEDTVRVALAYAPVDSMEEFKSPFAAVLNVPQEHQAIAKVDEPIVTVVTAPVLTATSPVQSASLVSLATPKSRVTDTKPKITIAGRIPMIKPDISAIPKSSGIAKVAVVRPKLGGKDHWWSKNKVPRAAFSRREQRCLAAAVYFEARGEPVPGQAAVAQVVLNRVKAPSYPSTVCGVVYQNKKWRNRCQFSFACDGIRDKVTDKKSYAQAQKVAKNVTSGKSWSRKIGSSTHYHATYVSPKWAKKMKRITKIGRHIFYKTYNGGWS
ncbi:cell wall hydrolase [Pararhizobium sp. IMCC21322]|uniref:cell wall hydrolase n=1 Tax=Pararhizobium sp. IMCC21322 TaxID=3067903 RepID=UPI002740CA91|nr:cell wall hydrolase [Pararhizobium sp. IMCC21322]